MSFSSQARTGINILSLVELEGDSIERIISVIQKNPEYFQVRMGHSCLEAAAKKLEQLIEQAAQQSVHPTLLPVREIEVSCPECNLYFNVALPAPHAANANR